MEQKETNKKHAYGKIKKKNIQRSLYFTVLQSLAVYKNCKTKKKYLKGKRKIILK